jgi:hypothetical protein
LDSDYLTAAPVREYLRGVVKVRINPEQGPAEEAIAKQYGVTGYPAFFVMRTPTSPPRKVHPFRRGKDLTPAEFANACEQAASLSTSTRITNVTSPQGTRTNTPGNQNTSTTRQKLKAQIVEVPSAAAPSTTNTNAALPTVEAVLDKYVAAIGGREAQKRITSRVTKGRVGGKLEVFAKAPNKSLTIMDVEPLGVIKQGFDGRTGWTFSQNGLEIANEVDRAALADADFYRDIKLKELYTRIKVIDKVKEGFREVYVVEATPSGGSAERFYFDVDSGLLVRRDLTRPMSRGPMRAEVYFSDWREVDGVKIPFKMTQVMPTRKFVTTIEEVKHNVPVDEAIFRRP